MSKRSVLAAPQPRDGPPKDSSEKGRQKKVGKSYTIGLNSTKAAVNQWLVESAVSLFCPSLEDRPLSRVLEKLSRFSCVVFDMDHTISSQHCGSGLPLADLPHYINAASWDFILLADALAAKGVKLAVATGSDAAEYDLPGHSRQTHICGEDLVAALLHHVCKPATLKSFDIFVGYDDRLQPEDADKGEREGPVGRRMDGKRHHMRRIAAHYGCAPSGMVLFDDVLGNLENEDGWHGIHVRERAEGLRFEDIFCDGGGGGEPDESKGEISNPPLLWALLLETSSLQTLRSFHQVSLSR